MTKDAMQAYVNCVLVDRAADGECIKEHAVLFRAVIAFGTDEQCRSAMKCIERRAVFA
jgi:hypothetical protein